MEELTKINNKLTFKQLVYVVSVKKLSIGQRGKQLRYMQGFLQRFENKF